MTFSTTNESKCGSSEDDIVNRIDKEFRRPPSERPLALALIGYSHGGGLAYVVSEALRKGRIYAPLIFSAYIDGVRNPIDQAAADPLPHPETRIPIGSKRHVNYYQSHGIVDKLTDAAGGDRA